ncbi:MAG: flagellar biosynthetic protein FliP, partial [Deltaproteobacteria bacterium]|nr:flagellar biosynthetic protein FliP [Deltaproteobacteria bacterium]
MGNSLKIGIIAACLIAVFVVPLSSVCWGAAIPGGMSFLNIGLDKSGDTDQISVVLQIFLLLTVLSLAPAIFITLTSFTRIVIVLSLLRRAMGTMQ